jgi:very-short-patch-repair endonuclease
VKRKKAANYISCDPFPKHREADERIKELSKAKRSGMTNAESILWYNLRNRFTRHKFRRQFSINDKYIVDFICLEKRLIIEVDGGQHNESRKDKERTGYLGRENFRVIRLWNNDIYFRLSASMEMIYKELEGIE